MRETDATTGFAPVNRVPCTNSVGRWKCQSAFSPCTTSSIEHAGCVIFLRVIGANLNLDALTLEAKKECGELPVLYAGGVMSNKYIREYLSKRHDAAFAPAEYSADNACGTAILAARRYETQNR
jgi:tRNA A37 threonylcarbamoyltransferase TsaD